jgi:hypothetical protein
MAPAYASARSPRRSAKQEAPPDDTAADESVDAESGSARTAAQERRERLQRARKQTASLVGLRLSEELTVARRVALLRTAGAVADLLSDLALDEDFWSAINDAQIALEQLPTERLVNLQEVIQSDLASLLDIMGYTDPPPPPSEELAVEMQVALHAILEPDVDERGLLGHEVQQQMLAYVFRLRRLLHEVDDPGPAGGETHMRRLMVMLRDGARAIGPAAVAAGVTATLFPPAAVGAAGALAMTGVDAGLKAAVGEGAQLGAAALIDRALMAGRGSSSAVEEFQAAVMPFLSALENTSLVLDYLLEEQTDTAMEETKAFIIDAMHWSYEVERAMRRQAPGVWPPAFRLALRAVQQEVITLREWTGDDLDYEALEDIRDRFARSADQMTRHLT